MTMLVRCPRCAREEEQRFYGPCATCRDELRATVAGESHEREADEFVPRMNVTPNAVALKD